MMAYIGQRSLLHCMIREAGISNHSHDGLYIVALAAPASSVSRFASDTLPREDVVVMESMVLHALRFLLISSLKPSQD